MKVISDSYDLNNKVTSPHTFLTRTEFFFPAKNANKSLLLPSFLTKIVNIDGIIIASSLERTRECEKRALSADEEMEIRDIKTRRV